MRLETVSQCVSLDQPEAGTSGGGPVCQQANKSATNICQLETRTDSHGHRCIHSGLGRAQSICQSPVEPDRQSAGTDLPTTGRTCSSSTSMEGTGMVPSVTGDAGGNPIPDPPEEGPHHSHTSGQPPRGGSPTCHKGYLRQCYKFSEGATKLLLASWRQKSSKTYDSLFGKWASWCGERDCDPVSCPIGEVINFLAHFFEQGYQYRSINSYRSAISSMVSRILKGIFHERPPSAEIL